jgi:hypothetical protein
MSHTNLIEVNGLKSKEKKWEITRLTRLKSMNKKSIHKGNERKIREQKSINEKYMDKSEWAKKNEIWLSSTSQWTKNPWTKCKWTKTGEPKLIERRPNDILIEKRWMNWTQRKRSPKELNWLKGSQWTKIPWI